MPAYVKATWIFEQGNRGWTESLLYPQNSDDISLALNAAILLGQKRAKLLGSAGKIKAIRVSLEKNLAGVMIAGDALLNYVNIQGYASELSDAPDTCLLVTFRTLNGTKRKQMFMRGIWDQVVSFGGQYLPTYGNWQSFFNSWMAQLITSGWGWWGNDVVSSARLTSYSPNTPTMLVQITADADIFLPPFNIKGKVRITGVNGKSVLNGTQIIESRDATHCDLVKPLAVGPFVSPGKIAVYGPVFRATSDVQASRIIERKAGSPLLESRGRQRARART